MHPFKTLYSYLWLIVSLGFGVSCYGYNTASRIVFFGSTPADEEIKSILYIPSKHKVDFIKWHLMLEASDNEHEKTFLLNLVYGESEDNTMGFKRGGEQLSVKGNYRLVKNEDPDCPVYYLRSSQLSSDIRLLSLNDNLLHLLNSKSNLMVGNGGWSYTLNRKDPVQTISVLPAQKRFSPTDRYQSVQLVFEGRTPCAEFAKEYKLNVAADCFKLKWKLTLNRDPVTKTATTYKLQTTFNRDADIEGKWTERNGAPSDPGAIIYRLLSDQPQKEFFLLAVDDLLFFLDKNLRLYTGNSDFSFTLNKKMPDNISDNHVSLEEAEEIIGEAAAVTDQQSEENDTLLVDRKVFTALEAIPGTSLYGNLYFSSEQYKMQGAAESLINAYIESNQDHSGFELIKGLGDKAFLQTDTENFITFIAVKSNRMIRLKVNKVTSKTSMTALTRVMKRLLEDKPQPPPVGKNHNQ